MRFPLLPGGLNRYCRTKLKRIHKIYSYILFDDEKLDSSVDISYINVDFVSPDRLSYTSSSQKALKNASIQAATNPQNIVLYTLR